MRLWLAKQGILSTFQSNSASSVLPAVGAGGGERKEERKRKTQTHIKEAESTLMGCLELGVAFVSRFSLPGGCCLLSPAPLCQPNRRCRSPAPSFPRPLPVPRGCNQQREQLEGHGGGAGRAIS